MADVGAVLDVELHQEVEIPRRRVDLLGDLGVGELVGHLVGLSELAFDLHEEGNHACLGAGRSEPQSRQSSKKARFWQAALLGPRYLTSLPRFVGFAVATTGTPRWPTCASTRCSIPRFPASASRSSRKR